MLTDYGLSEGTINGILDIHAHELAERIRNWNGPDSVAERWADGLTDAADFIDPQVQP
jgi:hypothetical protein